MSQVLEYKCPSCGGAIEFDSSLQKMKCPYCEAVIDMEKLSGKDEVLDEMPDPSTLPEDNFNWEEKAGTQWDESETENMSVFTCKSCGGEIVGDNNMAATECPYCGNNVVISGRFQGTLKPDYVIPFKLDREAAKAKYKQHISKKFLLPKFFHEENHIDEIKGIYVPFWIYNSKVNAFARFDAENVRHWSDSNYNYTEITSYDVFRAGTMGFQHIPVDGSTKIPDDLMESIEPFNFSAAIPFQTAYLAGYFADKYDVDDKRCEQRANERLRQSTIDIFRSTVNGYTNVSFYDDKRFRKKIESMDETSDYKDPFADTNCKNNGIDLLEGTVKYALYPVYLLTSRYKGNQYTFAMNGQTGKFVGNLPVDKSKRNITFAAVFAAVTALSTLIAQYLIG